MSQSINLMTLQEVIFDGTSINNMKLNNTLIWEGKKVLNIGSNWQNLNIYDLLIQTGWNGTMEVLLKLSAGKYIWSDNAALPAMTMGGTYPNGITFVNNGFIMGKGGNGEICDNLNHDPFLNQYYDWHDPSNIATDGGPAIELTDDMTIDNTNGYIGGGGGGGAGMGAGGGAGGGEGGYYLANVAAVGGSNGTTGLEHMTAQAPVPAVGNACSQPFLHGNNTLSPNSPNQHSPTQTGAGGSGGMVRSDQPAFFGM